MDLPGRYSGDIAAPEKTPRQRMQEFENMLRSAINVDAGGCLEENRIEMRALALGILSGGLGFGE
jgi:hypothetical protein